MMLDSSLGKILSTTKPVEPSIPGNSHASETKDDSVANTTKSEAEVRIVFRFTVEEHIVYNGKVEQVKQLGNEDISRIVSRIAWDGAKDQKKPILNKDIIENSLDVDNQDKTKQVDCLSLSASQPMDTSIDVISEERPREVSQNTISDIDCTKDKCEIDSQASVPTNTNLLIDIDKNLVDKAKLTPENQTREEVTSLPYSYHICETNLKPDGSYDVQEEDKCQPLIEVTNQSQQEVESPKDASPSVNESFYTVEAKHTDNQAGEEEGSATALAAKAVEVAALAAAESQMIVEALYDCVYNVDLESRKSDLASTVNNETLEQTHPTQLDKPYDATRIQHNELSTEMSKEVAKIDKKPLTEAANVPPNQDITQETIPNSENSYLKSKGVRSNQACKDDLNLSTDTTNKSDIILTSRRRNTCDAVSTTNRRIRRSGSKDIRTTRVSSNDRQRENNNRNSAMMGELDNTGRHFPNQSKVFAKWSDNHFYPGTILKSARDRKFEIGFFDGARKDVVETDLIPLSTILCKQVRVSIAKDYCVNAIVHEQSSNNGQPMFDVSYQQNGMVRKCVPLGDIFLTADQGTSLINQPMRPDKNPDESMFAGVDLDNIVHNKRSRRLQEMEDLEMSGEGLGQASNTIQVTGKRKRGQYNTRTSTSRARTSNIKIDLPIERGLKRSHSDVNNQETPISSCSPDNIKPLHHSSNSNPPSESSSSIGSTNSASNGHDMNQEFYFESTSPHRTKTSLLS